MCLDLVAEIVESEALMTRLALPSDQFDTIRQSFRSGERALYGRFDLAYDGRGPAKLLEYNPDTPTGVFEWGVGDLACGLGIREDRSRITCNLSRFVRPVIVDRSCRSITTALLYSAC